jgi:Flp pilus assembly protein TadG
MTIWMLGLSVAVMFLGGLSVDLWRVIELRRSLAATADAMADAGANGLDEAELRRGATRLDPDLAERLARRQLEREREGDRADQVDVEADESRVEVELVAQVEFSLLGIFVVGDPIEVHARATAEPRRSA